MNDAPDAAPADISQRRAADPEASSWVTASAGTGKTKVLTDRVLRLLLEDADPAKILCLTYTKAAAAEMENRIVGQLGEWAVAPDGDLAKALARLTGAAAETDDIAMARKLFARVLDTPGGLKIETIHGFCQSILKRFPLEAGVSPHFTVLEEHDAAGMRQEALTRILARAERERKRGGGPHSEALAVVTRLAAEQTFVEVLNKLLFRRGRLEALVGGVDDAARGRNLEDAVRRLYSRLGVDPEETESDVIRAAVADAALDVPTLGRLAAALQRGGKTASNKGVTLADWLTADDEGRLERFDDYCRVFLKADGQPFADMMDKPSREAFPDGEDFMQGEANRLVAVKDRLRALTVAQASTALLRLGAAVLREYDAAKDEAALLDYDDLIGRTRGLLDASEAAWVLYKLDGGLDHILIDEAQDTSPDQWRLILRIAEEFFAGEGIDRPENGLQRTIFAVGDYKQSIYRFQGADPDEFRRCRSHFEKRVTGAGRHWAPVALDLSFRSTEAILAAVDAVFNETPAGAGVVTRDEPARHRSDRDGQHGTVTLWPLVPPTDPGPPQPWALPEVEEADMPARRLVATGIAETIAGWLQDESLGVWERDGGDWRQRPVRAGDIMVLVRNRNEFIDNLVSELKARDIAVAGIDRMILTEQLAVRDLLALAEFLLLPGDDLRLAEVLRGPLVGLGEDELFELAYRRDGSLWRRLTETASKAPASPFARAHELLSKLLGRVDYRPPFELFAEVLEARGGRRRLIGRLGAEAEDPIDEFLSLALTYQRLHPPSLQGFVHWVTAGGTEVKRDLEQATPSEVRIMTVHGAKGLQAPVVFLPDTVSLPQKYGREPVLWDEETGLPLWAPTKHDHDPVAAAARDILFEREMAEYGRLLYVAATRAADHLIVCSWHDKDKPPPDESWYACVEAALNARDETERREVTITEGWGGAALVLESGKTGPAAERPAPAGERPPVIPDWAHRAPEPEPAPPAPLSPSRPSEDETEPAVLSPIARETLDETIRFRRGLLIHRLLQTLPDLPAGARRNAAIRYLEREGVAPAEAEAIAAEVLTVIETPDFAPLFAPGSMAEVPLTGVVGEQVVSGQIDRLAVTRAEVMIVDYKSNRPPPPDETKVAPLYMRQMAAYRALVRKIFPDRAIRCALLWTDGPTLMLLSGPALDRHAPE